MNIEIRDKLDLNPYGLGAVAQAGTYAATAFQLSGRVWQLVKENGLRNKGINIWVYDANHTVFAGVELEAAPPPEMGLTHKPITLSKYAYYKHVGPYDQIAEKGQWMTREVTAQGFAIVHPYIEIYGHWTQDARKLETELLMAVG